jgi:co-chaperonin GroES (HSP10)
MNIKLTSDLVLIRRITNEAPTTSWGFQLPAIEESNETPWRGEVVAIGPGKPVKLSGAGKRVVDALRGLVDAYHAMPNVNYGARGFSLQKWQEAGQALEDEDGEFTRIPMSVRVGDIVIFSRNGYQEFKIDGETLIAMHEDSVLGVIDSKPAEGSDHA